MFLIFWAAPGSLRPRAGLGPSARVMEWWREGQIDSRCLGGREQESRKGWRQAEAEWNYPRFVVLWREF